jgi:hypothetical protein
MDEQFIYSSGERGDTRLKTSTGEWEGGSPSLGRGEFPLPRQSKRRRRRKEKKEC